MSTFQKHYKELVRFDKFLGMDLEVHSPGKITYTLELKDHHLTRDDQCHGGVISAMMDAVLGVSSLSFAIVNGNLCSTVEFKLNYISTAKPGETLIGAADIDYAGSKIISTSGSIKDLKTGRLIAKGMGTFLQYPLTKKPDLQYLRGADS